MRSRLIMAMLLSGCFLYGQGDTPAQPASLQAELSKLAEDAVLLQQGLPSITCKETVVSQLIKKSTVTQEVHLVAEVRIQRNSDGLLSERYDFLELNGNPYVGPEPKTPFFVEGAVDEGILVFLPSAQPFFDFTLSAGRLDYTARKGVVGNPPFFIPPSTHGFALLDAAGNLTHIERRADPKEAHRVRVSDFASYDFIATELNGRTYQLSTSMSAEDQDGSNIRRFQATVAGCRLFHATSTILPGASPAPTPPRQPHPHR